MLILWEHFKTKMKNISPKERMLHCIKIDKLKKMTLYVCSFLVCNIEQFIGWFAVSFSCGFLTDNYRVKKFNVAHKQGFLKLVVFNSRDLVSFFLLFGC